MSRLLRSIAFLVSCAWPVSVVAQSVPSPTKPEASSLQLVTTDTASTLSLQPIARGTQVQINDRLFDIPWQQWQLETGVIQTGIGDTGLVDTLGIQLNSSNDPNWQPFEWFGEFETNAIRDDRDRYLDISRLALANGWQVRTIGDLLQIDMPIARINQARVGRQNWGKRIVFDLDRASAWQIEWRDRWVISIDATARNIDNNNTFDVQTSAGRTEILLDSEIRTPPRVFTLSDRPRLVIDIGADPVQDFDILWHSGIRWRQQMLAVGDRRVPAIWLEVDPTQTSLSLRPIWNQFDTQTGTEALVEIARRNHATAAINAGFFNRNNQLPLGAIRSDGNWHSGPILHRGVMAWNEAGEFAFDRLSIAEMVVLPEGDRLPILHLNSGYVQAGMGRYTPEWGSVYTNILDRETIVVVADNRILDRIETEKAGQTDVAIPNNGYVLVVRSDSGTVNRLAVGTEVAIELSSDPADLDRFPYIIGAGPLLLQNRQIVLDAESEQFNPQFSTARAVRSAIGRRSDGNLIVIAVQGNVTLEETAAIVRDLGAVDALNLDGGSSTALFLGGQLINRDPRTAAPIHNAIGIFIGDR